MRSIQLDKARMVKLPSGHFVVTLIKDDRQLCSIFGDRITYIPGTKCYSLYYGELVTGSFEAKEVEKVNFE